MSALGFQKPAVKGNYTSRWSISAANHPETSSTLFDWVQHHNHKYSCFMAMLEFLTRSKHGLSQGSQTSWFSPIMGWADSPSTWQMRNIKSWLLADSEGCASSALSSPLGWFCWVMVGQVACPSPDGQITAVHRVIQKPPWALDHGLYREKKHFPFWTAWLMAKAFLFSIRVSLKFILCSTFHQQPILQAKIKIRKTHLLLFFFKDLQGTCKKGKLIPWESRNLWDMPRK